MICKATRISCRLQNLECCCPLITIDSDDERKTPVVTTYVEDTTPVATDNEESPNVNVEKVGNLPSTEQEKTAYQSPRAEVKIVDPIREETNSNQTDMSSDMNHVGNDTTDETKMKAEPEEKSTEDSAVNEKIALSEAEKREIEEELEKIKRVEAELAKIEEEENERMSNYVRMGLAARFCSSDSS